MLSSAFGRLRQEGPGIADRKIDGERADRHGQAQGERGGARAPRSLRRGLALAHIGEQAGFDLATRFFVLVRGQRSGAQVCFELAQLIAVYRDIDGIARCARASAAAKQRRHDEKHSAGDEQCADHQKNGHRGSASFPARSV